jgi:hypothetical protein
MLALYRSGRQADALAAFRRLRDLLAGELGLEPAPALQDLEGRILRRDPGLAAPTRPVTGGGSTLPVPLTSFVGRTTEIAEIGELLGSQRLVTLLGPGGSGKTRLACELAARHLHSYPDGVPLVDLAPVTSPDAVAVAVAAALGVGGASERPTAAVLAEYLAGRRAMLVIDNCEHVAEAVAELLGTLLRVGQRDRMPDADLDAPGHRPCAGTPWGRGWTPTPAVVAA